MPAPWLLFISLLLPQAATECPKEAENLTSRADVQLMNRQFDTAIKLYREALAVSPDYPPAHKGLGRVSLRFCISSRSLLSSSAATTRQPAEAVVETLV